MPRSEYSCSEAINDLEIFFKKHLEDTNKLEKFLQYLDECKTANRVSFRFIHEELMKYRKENSYYFPITDAEKKMIDDLFYFWG